MLHWAHVRQTWRVRSAPQDEDFFMSTAKNPKPAAPKAKAAATKTKTAAKKAPVLDEIETPEKPEKDRKFVEALSRGLDVLRACSQGSVVLGKQASDRLSKLRKPPVSRRPYTL